MAIDQDKENEKLEDGIDFATLDFDMENEGIEIVSDSVLVGTTDCVVKEMRSNPKYEALFEKAIGTKREIIEERKAAWGTSNSEASDLIINTTESLNRTQYELEQESGEEIERVDYFTYRINGTDFSRDDLSIINATREEYDTCLEDAMKMKRDVRKIDRELRRIKLANSLLFRKSYTYKSDEYQLSCFRVNKTEKLNEDEAFLRKFDFIRSLSTEGYGLLRDLFVKSEMVGNALKTLEANGKEKQDMESREGQIALLREALERSVSSEEYAGLVEFINETIERVSSKDYDKSEVKFDNSEIGKSIKGFVNDLGKRKRDEKSIEEMLEKFAELNAEGKEDKPEVDIQAIEFEEIEDPEVFEEAVKSDGTTQIEVEEEQPKEEMSEKDIQNNMIVSLVLEGGKYRAMMQAIRDREKVIYNRMIDKKMKNYRMAKKYIESDKAKLGGLLEIPIKPEEDGCYFGNLFIMPEDLDLANLDKKGYAELLEKLDEIKKDRKAVEKDMRMNRREARRSKDSGYLADIALYQIENERDAIIEAQETTETEIKIAEFFAGLTEEQLHRTVLLIGAIGEKRDSEEKAKALNAQLENLEGAAKEDRQPIMEEALIELIREKIIPREEHKALVTYIRGYQKGFEDGTYKIVEGYGSDESSLGQVVYDYLDLMERNMDKIKINESKEQQSPIETPAKAKKEQDDDGDIII